MPTRNEHVKRETRVAEVWKQAVRRQLNRLGVAAQSTWRMLPKSAIHAPVSPDGVNSRPKG